MADDRDSGGASQGVELSIVVCVLDEEDAIERFTKGIDAVLPTLGVRGHEIVFVDDGSSDDTWERITALAKARDDIAALRLVRNVGKENALTAGLAAARGEVHVPMDVDLQDPPEVLVDLLAEWRAGAQVVVARRVKRDDSWLRRKAGSLVYRSLELSGEVTIPRDVGDFRLMTSEVTSRFLALPEVSRYNKGLFALVADEPAAVDYIRPSARGGDPRGSRQTLRKLVRLAIGGLVSFSTWPLQLLSLLGFLLVGFSILSGVLGVVLRVFGILEVPGQTTVVVLFAFLLGFQALSIGVLGLYVGQVLTEVKRRPLFFIAETHGLSGDRRASLEAVSSGSPRV